MAATTRDERKQLTRQALLDAALTVSLRTGFAAVSLREVTREAGVVPTAFYRHFQSLDQLALALVDDVCLRLRQIMREARTAARSSPDLAIRDSVRGYLMYVRTNARAFEFLVRERSGGSRVLREAIGREILYFVRELADDLRLLAPFAAYSRDDLEMIADLVVNAVMSLTLDVQSVPEGQTERARELTRRGVKQLRLIFLGAAMWKPELGAQRA